jgi:hypothetical protein
VRNRVRHTNLLSRMPGVRTHQAERKFAIDIGTSIGGHGPSRGLDAPLALQKLYHECAASMSPLYEKSFKNLREIYRERDDD